MTLTTPHKDLQFQFKLSGVGTNRCRYDFAVSKGKNSLLLSLKALNTITDTFDRENNSSLRWDLILLLLNDYVVTDQMKAQVLLALENKLDEKTLIEDWELKYEPPVIKKVPAQNQTTEYTACERCGYKPNSLQDSVAHSIRGCAKK